MIVCYSTKWKVIHLVTELALIVLHAFLLNFDQCFIRASPVTQTGKNLPAMQETWVPSLGQEDPLEKEMATHSSILAWRIPWTEDPDRLQSMGLQRVGDD